MNTGPTCVNPLCGSVCRPLPPPPQAPSEAHLRLVIEISKYSLWHHKAQCVAEFEARATEALRAENAWLTHELGMQRDGTENAIREAYKLLDIEDDGELRHKWVLLGIASLRAQLQESAEREKGLRAALRDIQQIGETELVHHHPQHGSAPHQVALIARAALTAHPPQTAGEKET